MDSPNYGSNSRPPRNRNAQQNIPPNFPNNPPNTQFDPNFYSHPNFPMFMQNIGTNPYPHQFSYGMLFPNPQQISSPNQLYNSQMSPGVQESSSYHQIQDDNEENEVEAGGDVGYTFPPYSDDPTSIPSLRASKTWSTVEDEALISSFMSNSCDAVVGTNQKSGKLWSKIMATFEAARAANPRVIAERNMDSLKGRWRRIGASVMKWTASYDDATNRRRSGMNDEDVIREAHQIYEQCYKGKFLFYHAWVMLNKYPKWRPIVHNSTMNVQKGRPKVPHPVDSSPETGSSGKRARVDESGDFSIPSNPNTPTSGDAGMGSYSRPEGVKKAKQKGKGKASSSASDAMSHLGDSINFHAEATNKHHDLEEKKLEYRKEKLEKNIEAKKWEAFTALLNKQSLTPAEEIYKNKLATDLGLY